MFTSIEIFNGCRTRLYRSDGVSTKPDFEDMVGHSYTLGKFNRLAGKEYHTRTVERAL